MRARSPLQLEDMDPTLRPFLQAEDEAEAQRLLAQLIEDHVQPLVREIAHSKLRVARPASAEGSSAQEAHDICGEAVLQLLSRLHDLRDGRNQAPIANFRGYVAVVTYNAYGAGLRRKYPERQRLKNRLRYVLNHDPRFAIWEGANGASLCGLAAWKERNCSTSPPQRTDDRSTIEQFLPGAPNLRQLMPRALLDSLFSLSGRPIEIEELVSMAAKIWDIQDMRQVENDDAGDGEVWNRLPDPRVNVATLVERRMYLAALWKEICELRPLQRVALLLNLHDASGQDMLPLFILVDIAHLPEIAASLDMPVQEFAELWESLPLDDTAIAQRLGITRQQVINLRKSARERLARRMAKSW
jgi:DNA-directed RNA polymerase specialized sigma24 family protein